MRKCIRLALNAFATIPSSLGTPATGHALPKIEVGLADLYHHYYLDSWGVAPPDPDPAHFEQVRYLMPCADFRFSAQGMGIAKTFRGNKSNELGQAFCRWFLGEHLGIDYVAHIEEVRGHAALPRYGGVSVLADRSVEGDAPDYFCASGPNDVCLAEAKGTRHAVGFGTKEFLSWRKQFDRVRVLDAHAQPLMVKGYIVAMRWATGADGPRIGTKLSAEDPATRGERPLRDERFSLAYAVKSIHYASTLQRLRHPLVSEALLRGFAVPDELRFRFTLWRCLLAPFAGMTFAGGYFPGRSGSALPFELRDDGTVVSSLADPLRLDVASGTFFGVEQGVLKTIMASVRGEPALIGDLGPVERPEQGYSALSLLRDGHVLGPIELFLPVGTIEL